MRKTSIHDETASRLLIIGPEGGFSPQELELLHSKEALRVVNLPTPILRSPTAVAAGAGIMIESLLK
jgi:RsmE family RNA methyltransferase